MRLFILLLLISFNCKADQDCIDREWSEVYDANGVVTGEEYSEIVEFCKEETTDEPMAQ